jgi:hypothetical protein
VSTLVPEVLVPSTLSTELVTVAFSSVDAKGVESPETTSEVVVVVAVSSSLSLEVDEVPVELELDEVEYDPPELLDDV